jgi:adenylate kinase
MRIVLLGAPGAGKGTQCKKLVATYGLAHLSSGDILRKERSEGTELGRQAQHYMDSGGLVPDELVVAMMVKEINEGPTEGFILDGFPRTVNQAEKLDQALEHEGKKIDVIFNLQVDDAVIADRMSGRRSCPKCGAVYHVTNFKPKKDGVCDNDGEALIQRPDDNLDVVKKRLETYHEQTKPVVDYYKDTGANIHDIDANGGSDVVDVALCGILDQIEVG